MKGHTLSDIRVAVSHALTLVSERRVQPGHPTVQRQMISDIFRYYTINTSPYFTMVNLFQEIQYHVGVAGTFFVQFNFWCHRGPSWIHLMTHGPSTYLVLWLFSKSYRHVNSNGMDKDTYQWRIGFIHSVQQCWKSLYHSNSLLLMEEILHQLGCIKACI